MVKRVCRSGVAVTLMLVLLFTTFASLFVFTNKDVQGADTVSYTVQRSAYSYGLGGIYGYKYQARAKTSADYKPVHDMFCLQPSRDGWENGSTIYDDAHFQILDKTGIDNSKRELMYKAVYYGYKGAGWNIRDSKGNYVWQKKIDDIMAKHKVTSANTRDMNYYLITHFVVSYIYNSSDDKFKLMSSGWLKVIKDLTAEYSNQKSVTNKMAIYVANLGNKTSNKQTMIIAVYARRLRIKKVSSDTRFIKGQGINSNKVGAIKTSDTVLSSYADYSGARIAIFKSKSLADKAAKQTTQKAREAGSIRVFTTNKDGGCSEDHIVGAGDNDVNYYAVESKGPNSNSYAVSNEVYQFKKSNDYSSHIDGLPLWTVTIKDTPRGVNLKITKASANPDMTKNNSNYSLEGAKFAIFTSKSTAEAAVKGKGVKTRTKGSLAIKITTDGKGVGVFKDSNGKTVKLPLLPSSQAYYAVEYAAPKGYELYNSVITFKKGSLSGTVYQYTASIKEKPKSDPIGIIAQKKDSFNKNYDKKNLAGAVFAVKYYDIDTSVTTNAAIKTINNGKKAMRTWYFKTDDNGEVWYDNIHLVNTTKYASDKLYVESSNNRIPPGWISVEEVAAPTSGMYEINTQVYYSKVTGTEPNVKVNLKNTIPEDPLTTGISVIKKSDDGLVANIYFRVTSSDGKVNEIIKTDESGSAHLDGLDVCTSDGKKIEYTTSELGLMTSGSDADRQKAKYKIPGRYKKPADQSTTLTPDKPSRIIFINEIETGSIKIVKQAEDNSSDHNTVSNITFKVVDSSNLANVYTVVTDTSGNATLSNLPIYNDDGNVIKYKVSELGVASTVQRNYIYGDVDFDGEVTNYDAVLVLKYARNLVMFDDTQIKVADVNGDGKITQEDSDCINKYRVGITDTSEIGKTNTVCSELGEGQFTEYSIPKRYNRQADRTISLTADQTFTVTFVNTILTGTVTIEKTVADNIANYDTSVANLWFKLTDGEDVNAYAPTDSSGHATFADLPVYDDYDEKIVYTVTELGFKQTDDKYLYPAYYVAQEPKNVTIDEKTVNAFTTYNGVAAFHNRFYTASLIVLKSFYPITEDGVYAKFRIRSRTDGYSYDRVYTTSLHPWVAGEGNQNGCLVPDIIPFLANGTSIVYEISEIAIVDSAGHELPETYMSLLDSARISWTLDDFTNEKNKDFIYEDEDEINISTVYTIDNYYTTGHLNIYKTADDNDVSDVWFKIECANSLIETKYVKTDKHGHAELDKIVAGTVKDGQLTYTVTELGKLKTGSEDAPESATFEIPSKYAKPKPKTFTFDAGEIEPDRTLAFSNKLYGSFRVHKVDNAGKAVANAKFQLINSSGKVVGTCTTKDNGYSNTLSRLPQGVYTVKEISTPKGFYLLKNESQIYIGNATVNAGYPWIGNDFVDGTKYVYGDVNLDGTVDAEDSVLIQQAIGDAAILTDMQKKVADVTKDGEITTHDAVEINRYVSQLKVTELNYTYDVTETEQPPFPPAGGMNLFGVVIASSLLLSALGSLMIVRRKAGK